MLMKLLGFPCGSVVKNLPANTGDLGLIPGGGNGKPTPVCLPGKPHGQRSLAGCCPWGWKESDTTQQLNNNNKITNLKTSYPYFSTSLWNFNIMFNSYMFWNIPPITHMQWEKSCVQRSSSKNIDIHSYLTPFQIWIFLDHIKVSSLKK